jgi:hypothetical protein
MEGVGACNREVDDREMVRVKMSKVSLKVSGWEVESVDRARVKRAS